MSQKKLSTVVGDSTYARASATYRSPLQSNNDKELLIKFNRAIEASFREIKSKSKPEHTRKLFSELAALQRSIQHQHRSIGSIEQD
jgi:RIO-like serine/threonine protein kinase